MNIAQRASAYNKAFPNRPGLLADAGMVVGTWMIGACYKNHNEEWQSIPGWNYSASSHGRIRNDKFKNREPMTSTVGHGGYASVELHDGEGSSQRMKVHRLVCAAFHGEPLSDDLVVRHLDGDSYNNAAYNLLWGTQKDNAADRDAHGRTAAWKAILDQKCADDAVVRYKAHMLEREADGFKRAKRGFVRAMAEEFGLSVSAMQKVFYGVTWNNPSKPSGSIIYGAYPYGYLERVHAMFPDAVRILHVFSGGLTLENAKAASSNYYSNGERLLAFAKMELVDIHGPEQGRHPTWQGDLHDMPEEWNGRFDLILADPPYSKEDAEVYDCPAPNRAKIMRTLARVAAPGGNLVWLDQVWPMHRKTEWKTWGTVGLIRSTNHRVRLVSFFERQPCITQDA